MNSEASEMYEIIAKSLEYYSEFANALKNELKKSNDEHLRYGNSLLELFGGDLDSIVQDRNDFAKEINNLLTSTIKWTQLPKIIKDEEKLVGASLALYKKHLLELQDLPKVKGMSEGNLPSIKWQIDLIDKTVKELNINLPPL